MRIAVYTSDKDTRYNLSRQVEDALQRQGILGEMTLFPMLPELLEASGGEKTGFDLILVGETRDTVALQSLCRRSPVIMVGNKCDGPEAFDVGASYFIEAPAQRNELDKALARCLSRSKK